MLCSRKRLAFFICGLVIFITTLTAGIIVADGQHSDINNFTTQGVVLNTKCIPIADLGAEKELEIAWNITVNESNVTGDEIITKIQYYTGFPTGCISTENTAKACCGNLIGKNIWFRCNGNCDGENKIIEVSDVSTYLTYNRFTGAFFLIIVAAIGFGVCVIATFVRDDNSQRITF